MCIYNFSKQFPNCGILKKILQKFIEDLEEEDLGNNKENGFDEKLCNCIESGNCDGLFNNESLKEEIKLSKNPIHNKGKLQGMLKESVGAEEANIFKNMIVFNQRPL